MRALHLTLMLAMAVICLAPLRTAHGAEISAFRYYSSSDGCGGARNCFIITIDGPIEPGDHKKFRETIRNDNITHALVDLSSNGGVAIEGLGIGYAIKELGFSTRVMTVDTCASACAFIWLAGRERYLNGNVGFHTAYVVNAITREIIKDASGQPVRNNQNIEAYYKHLGLSDLAIHWLISPGPYEIIWMDARLASDIGVSVISAPPSMMTIHHKPTMTADQNEQNDDRWGFMDDLAPFWKFLTFLEQVWMSALKYPTTYEKEWPRDARLASDIGVSVTSAPPPMMTIHHKPSMTADQNEQQNDDADAPAHP
jgi:hypothetical protein